MLLVLVQLHVLLVPLDSTLLLMHNLVQLVQLLILPVLHVHLSLSVLRVLPVKFLPLMGLLVKLVLKP